MNKKFAIVLALALIAIVCCAGCIDPQEQVDPVDPVVPVDPVDTVTPVDPVVPDVEYSVFFMLNYDEAGAYTAETVTAGNAVEKPANPTRSGYTFKGWFTAAEGGAEYDFTQAVTADITLYAQWKKVSSSSSGSSTPSHTHSYTYASNNDGTHIKSCSCGVTTEDCKFSGYTCTLCEYVGNVYHIYNLNELQAFATAVNDGDSFSGKTVKLEADIDLGNTAWTQIGTAEKLFAGTFDGNGKTISNLAITGTEDVGLFGVLYGTVKNLNIDGATITVTPRTVGDSFDDGDDAGGIVGFNYNGDDGDFDVTGCTVKDSTITAFRDVGGIAGSANGDDVTGNTVSNVAIIVDKVTNAYNRADINGGEVVGRLFSDLDQNTVNDGCTVTIIYAEGFQSVQTETDSYYEISSAEGLGAFRDTVNAGETYKGKTVKLTADIDLENEEWTPIGTDWNVMPFSGTFDGQSNTISNLYINKPSGSNIGLFGSTTNGEIKNLKINNAKVTGRLNVGAVAGTPYTSKYTNIELTGHVEINGMAYVGAVGGRNAYADWTDITVDVDESSYVNANSIESGTAYRTYVGGVIGFIGEGGHTFKDITSNIDVIGTTCEVGGITGIAHYGTSYENCVCTGDVTITSATDVAESEEMGGIAGVWHNSADVTFTNCKFEGTLTANFMEGVDLSDNTITGKAYNENGTSYELIANNVIVNGYEINDKGINTGSTLWGNKNSMGTDKLNVVVDGVDVY